MMRLTAPDEMPLGSVLAELGFAPAVDVSLDTTWPGDMLRAKTHPSDEYDNNAIAMHPCRIDDLAAGAVEPGLATLGFDAVDISGLASLQRVLARVRGQAR